MDATSTPYLNEHLATWCLMLASFPLAFFVIRTIKETNYDADQVVYVGEAKEADAEDKTGADIEKASDHSETKVLSEAEVPVTSLTYTQNV